MPRGRTAPAEPVYLEREVERQPGEKREPSSPGAATSRTLCACTTSRKFCFREDLAIAPSPAVQAVYRRLLAAAAATAT